MFEGKPGPENEPFFFTSSCDNTGGGVSPPLFLVSIFAGVHRLVSPFAATAGMGSEIRGSARGGSGAAHRRDESAPVERLLSRPGRSS
jgi:hypothetical protein